jgi:hypothetical protein
MKATSIIILTVTICLCTIGCNSEKIKRNTKGSISYYIGFDTGLKIDTSFVVVLDSSYNYDFQDYTAYYTIKFDSALKKSIIKQIVNSKYFNQKSITDYNKKFWSQIVNDSLKGFWISIDNGFQFVDIPCYEGYLKDKSTVIETKIDTLNSILEYEYHKL